MAISACPNCGSKQLYKTKKDVSAGGGYAPNYLPGLGSFWSAERFTVVLCNDCGLTRFFATQTARAKLSDSSRWERV
jgi:predicted nucleic-acid-binding Zn-ribbon protein